MPGLTIDCGTCIHEGSDVCEDCVVTFVLDQERPGLVLVAPVEAEAISALSRAGLVPPSRHQREAS